MRITGWPPLALFFAAVAANTFGLLYVGSILPESLESSKLSSATASDSRQITSRRGLRQVIKRSLEPLLLLAPRKEEVVRNGRRTWRWNLDLTLLGIAVFCGYLTNVSANILARLYVH